MGAEVNKDLLLADVREVRVAAQRPVVEHHGIHGEHRLGVVRRPCHALAKGAMASERAHGRLRGSEPNLSAEAAALEVLGHVMAFRLMRASMRERFLMPDAMYQLGGVRARIHTSILSFPDFYAANHSCTMNDSRGVFQESDLVLFVGLQDLTQYCSFKHISRVK